MADRKISDLTALTTPASGDYLPIVDISEAAAASKNKRVTVQSLFQGIPVNVGIGTSSPAERLDLGGEVSDTVRIRFTMGGNVAAIGSVGSGVANGQGNLTFFTRDGSNLLERLRIDSFGRVGIGTSSPGANSALEVAGNQKYLSVITNAGGGGSVNPSNSAGLHFSWNRSNGDGESNIIYGTGAGSAPNLQFASWDGTTYTERLRIDSSGRLLVGTSSAIPTAFPGILQVNYGGGYTADFGRFTNDIYGGFLNLVKGRGGAPGTRGIVQAGDILGQIDFVGDDGADLQSVGAFIRAQVDGTPGANDMPGRLVFSTTADGAGSPTERMRIAQNGLFTMGGFYVFTTAGAANVNVDSNGVVQRSTSSAKYKTNVETLEDSYSDALLKCRPVWYQSTCERDNPSWGWWGFIAEEVAEIDPRLVHWKTTEITYDDKGSAVTMPCDPEPEGVQYDRFVPHLLNLIKRQKEQIEAMEARIETLEAAVAALQSA